MQNKECLSSCGEGLRTARKITISWLQWLSLGSVLRWQKREAHEIPFWSHHSKDVGSVYNVHIYAMYEGSDCHQNMTLVLL